jgi:hypothetical protein
MDVAGRDLGCGAPARVRDARHEPVIWTRDIPAMPRVAARSPCHAAAALPLRTGPNLGRVVDPAGARSLHVR